MKRNIRTSITGGGFFSTVAFGYFLLPPLSERDNNSEGNDVELVGPD